MQNYKKIMYFSLSLSFFLYFCGVLLIYIGMPSRPQLLIGVLLILLGGMIYLSFRPTSLLLFHVLDGLGVMPLMASWRDWVADWQPSEFVVYSLPGGLWAASYILLTYPLLLRQQTWCRIAITGSVPLMGFVSELLQQGNLLPGVFDIADLCCYAVPLLLLILYETSKYNKIWQTSLTASTASN